jgi:hypothetical protein
MRVENLGPTVSAWCAATGEGSTTHDICRECAHLLDTMGSHALDAFLSPLGYSARGGPEPRGEDGWGGAVEHPPYAELEPVYGGAPTCAACGAELTEEDD